MHNTHYTMYTYNVLIRSTELNCSYQCQISGTNWILDDFFYKTRQARRVPCALLRTASARRVFQRKTEKKKLSIEHVFKN